MKPVLMFTLAGCPYCREALAWMDALRRAHPEYAAVPLTLVDEREQPDVANAYDYWYVPTFYVGADKLHEGAATPEIIVRVFARALNA